MFVADFKVGQLVICMDLYDGIYDANLLSPLYLPLHPTPPAGVSPQSFFKHHSAIHDTIKGRLIPSYLTTMCPILSAEFNNSLRCHGDSGKMELMDFVRDPMFEAVVMQLFGRENVPEKTVCALCVEGVLPCMCLAMAVGSK